MSRFPRLSTRPNAGFEIMNRCIQGRHLIKPSPRLNKIIIGALAKAREKYPVEIYSGAFLSSHWHLHLQAPTMKIQARFMAYFTRKLSIESGILYDWKTSTFPDRYHSSEVSQEPEAQIKRLVYHLQQGAKEGLVSGPLDWPGVNFVEALITGEPLKGIWIDRSGYYRASQRDENVTLEDFTEHLELPIAPLPCWAHLSQESRRELVLDIIREIEEETAAHHAENCTAPLGAEVVLAGDPHYYPTKLKKSPQPRFHAFRKKIRQELREAFSLILTAYYEAAERLRAGERNVEFPENSFPPGLPFVEPAWALAGHTLKSPEPG